MRRLLVVLLALVGVLTAPAGALAMGAGTSFPVAPSGIGAVLDVDAWHEQTCVVLADRSVRCWGRVSYGTSDEPGKALTSPTAVPGIADAAKVSGTCVVKTDGTVWCWGDSWLGDTPKPEDAPAQVSGIDGVSDLAVGDDATCALRTDATVWCWGWPRHGATGSNYGWANLETQPPLQVAGLTGATAVASGQQHSCAVQSTGALWCWGDGGAGGPSPPTGPLATYSGITGVATATSQTCTVDVTGAVRCRGDNSWGEAGVKPNGTASGAAPIAGLPAMGSVATGEAHTCAVTATGTGFCWGLQADGRLGNPAYGGDGTSESPIPVLGLTGIQRFVTGDAHTCAQLTDGTLRCFGSDALGQLGNGTEPLPADWSIDTPGAIQQADSTAPVRLPTPTPTPTATPVPTPKPAVKRTPQALLSSKSLTLSAFTVVLRKGAKCPKKLTITVRPKGKATPVLRKRVRAMSAAGGCTVTATLQLTGKIAAAKHLALTVSGAGVKPRLRALTRA
ncbi:MAG: hypothetical protein J7513_11165 [Solirubrobacteraceae bacterium]|nr:hypothetical protein [Solirubrobacteraceae bacterium]